jgi:hypothetical protein
MFPECWTTYRWSTLVVPFVSGRFWMYRCPFIGSKVTNVVSQNLKLLCWAILGTQDSSLCVGGKKPS